jgi:beta-galactosidase
MTAMKQMKNLDAGIVKFSAEGIMIEDKLRVVLCASAFYFRIPCCEWRDRLEKVKAAGYNCIDVYIPWNYHETEEGCWEFEGQKDVEAYFKLAAELGLWIIARPGPYICSEWDMGSLPAYLLTKEGLVLRDYNEIYLSCVKKWYDQIMPIIENYQLGKQGTVIAVQKPLPRLVWHLNPTAVPPISM